MRTVEGAGREDVGRSVHHQDAGQCVERRRFVRSPLYFSPDGRLIELERHREKKPSSRTFLFPAYGFNTGSESSVDTRETARVLYYRSSQLGHRDRASEGRSSRDGEFILQPKGYENVRP
jgi:hypothetical protein